VSVDLATRARLEQRVHPLAHPHNIDPAMHTTRQCVFDMTEFRGQFTYLFRPRQTARTNA